jgi:hypothetical protein
MADLAGLGGAGQRHHVGDLTHELNFEPVGGGCEFDPFDEPSQGSEGFIAQAVRNSFRKVVRRI